ncbi:MAG: cohesin domain-containing protein, partial [Candidatus Krumholzibacteriia bacterium]
TTPDPPPATTLTPTPAGFTVEAGKRNLPQGGSVTVPVSLNNVDALANMNVNVHYDPAVVRPAQNAARGNLISQALFEANIRDRGVVRLGFAQRDDIQGTGTLAQIPFEAVGRPGSRTALRLELPMAATSTGSRVTPAQLVHGEIVIVGAEGRVPGDTTGTGTLTALDAMNALKMSVGNLSVDMNADMDQDGRVTARDATLIVQAVVGR